MRGKSGVEIQALRYVSCLRFHFIYGSSHYFPSHISISCRSFIYVSAYFITCSIPVLGLTLLTLFQLGQFGTERGGYLLTYCCLILQARHISTVKVSRVGGAQVIQVSAYCKIVVSSPSWGLPFSLCSNLASLEPREEVIYSHIVVSFCRQGER